MAAKSKVPLATTQTVPAGRRAAPRAATHVVDVAARYGQNDALRRDHEISEAIINSAQHIILVLDSEGRIVRFNPYMEALTGWTLREVEGRDWFETFLPARYRARIRDFFGRTLGAEGTRRNVNPILTKSGEELEIEWEEARLTSAGGQAFGLLCTGRDVTARRRMEHRLRESQARLQAEADALSRLDDATARLWRQRDLRAGLDEILNATLEMLAADFGSVQLREGPAGVPVIAARKKPPTVSIERCPAHPAWAEARATWTEACAAWAEASRPGKRAVVEDVETDAAFAPYRSVAANAGFRALQTTPLIGFDGEPLGRISTFWRRPRGLREAELQRLDLYALQAAGFVEQCRAIETLRDSEERIRAILETAVDSIVTLGADGIIHDANPATEKMFGYVRRELVGQSIRLLLPQRYQGEYDDYLARLETGRVHAGFRREELGRRKDRSTFPVGLTISRVENLNLFTAILRDISDLRELERQVLEIAAQEDQKIGYELHDNIQQQLTGLGLLTQTMAESLQGSSSPQVATALRLASGIKEAAAQVHLLARGLIPVDVDAEGLRAALADLATRSGELYGVNCGFRCAGAADLDDNFAATHLLRIAQEAVNNAAKHGHPRRIDISLIGRDGTFVLKVVDDGTGIGNEEPTALGMGTRIMHYRARLIGGTLKIAPAQRGGTSVTCTVFRKQAAPAG